MMALIVLTSCGGAKTEEIVLEDCVKIPAQSLSFSVKDLSDEDEKQYNLECMVIVEALKELDWRAAITMHLYDKDGVELIYLRDSDLPKQGEKKKCDFGLTWGNADKSEKELQEIISQTRSVKFKGEYLESISNNEETSVTNINNTETNITAGNDWDELLDDYEQYDSYIACMKKVSNGDMSAMSEYTTLFEKANSMNERISNIKGELSSSQLQRYMKLCEKLLNAASNM